MATYDLYTRKRGTRRWVRQSTLETTKQTAVRIHQSFLIAKAFDPDVEAGIRKNKRRTK